MGNYQIFISYRRDGGDALAGRLADRFTALGYRVFFDVESMRSGTFNTQILDAIAQCNDVLLVLPPHALDRCVNEDDWVRQELAFALKRGKNIIPVMMRGFEFPATLPADIDNVRNMEGVTASSEHFDSVIARIEGWLSPATRKAQLPQKPSAPKPSIKLPLFLKTPLSPILGIAFTNNFNTQYTEAATCFDTLRASSSLNDFCGFSNIVKANTFHDAELEFACFTNPGENIPIIIEQYLHRRFDGNALPSNYVEIYTTILSMISETVDKLTTQKPLMYEVILFEYMCLFFEMEYYYNDEYPTTLACANALFSHVFRCYPSDRFRTIFRDWQRNPKQDIMKHVPFALQNVQDDFEGTMQVLNFVFVLRFCMMLFNPTRKKLKRLKTFFLICYKHLKEKNVLNNDMAKAFADLLGDIDKINSVNC